MMGYELTPNDRRHLARAIELASTAEQEGNLPVGAVLAAGRRRVAEGRNAIWVPYFEGTRHAEIETLRAVSAAVWPPAKRLTLYNGSLECRLLEYRMRARRVGQNEIDD